MVLPQAAAVADGHEGDAQGLCVVVHDLFGLEGDAAGALVEDGVLGAVVEEAGHGDALLEAAGKDVAPLRLGIPALVVEIDEVLEAQKLQDGEEVGVADAAGAHLAQRVGVDYLLAERAAGEVGTLGDVENGAEGGLVDRTAVDGPEPTQDSEEGRLATAVRSDDKQVIAVLQLEGEGLD